MTARDGGPWRGITEAEQVARIAAGSTPLREFDPKSGEPFRPWIRDVEDDPAVKEAGERFVATAGGTKEEAREAYGAYLAARRAARALGCDCCLEGLPKDAEGFHLRVDPEGFEGTARIPCANP